MRPVNMGERSNAARMIACVAGVVCVMWQTICAGCSARRPRKENTGRRIIAGLLGQAAVVDAAAVDARRCAGLEARHPRRDFPQPRGQRERWRLAGATARVVVESHVNTSGKEGADGQHHGRCLEARAGKRDDTAYAAAFDDQVRRFLLEQLEARLVLQHAADGALVELTVGLRARRAYRRALARVQRAKLDAGAVGCARHRATERVDLAHQVALADAANRRIAAHRAELLDALGQQQCARTHARGRKRGFGAGVAAADYDDVIGVGKAHGGRDCSQLHRDGGQLQHMRDPAAVPVVGEVRTLDAGREAVRPE